MFADQLRHAVEASPRCELPRVSAALWKAYAAGQVGEGEAQALSDLIEGRKALRAPQKPGQAAVSYINGTTALWAFFGLSNVLLASQRQAYFGTRADFNPFVHTWSLGVEEQFYLAFPVLVGPRSFRRPGANSAFDHGPGLVRLARRRG